MKKVSWLCFILSIIIFVSILLWGRFRVFVIHKNELEYIIASFFISTVITFVTAFILGIQNASIKWIYAIFPVVYGFLFSDLVYTYLHNNVFLIGGFIISDWSNFYFFSGLALVVAFMGLGVGMGVKILVKKRVAN